VAFRAYALTIAGCPWAFTDTPGLPSLTSSSPLWPSPAEVAAGFLVRPAVRWAERAKPLDGELDVDSLRFQLHDAPATVDGATRPLLAWLATRAPSSVTSTPLAASMSATATTFVVGSGAVLTIPGVAWIEGEAINCASRVTNTITVATGGRGYYGTRAKAHTIDGAQALYPEVFAQFPWVTRRKVCLWAVDSAGVCTLLWVGYATRAPALSEDGARYDLACDHLWTVQRGNPVGGALGSTRAVGYGTTASSSAGALLTTSFTMTISGTVQRGAARSRGPFRDWSALSRHHETAFASQTTTAGARINLAIGRAGSEARLDADVLTATVPIFTIAPTLGGKNYPSVLSEARGTRQTISTVLTEVPSVLYLALWNTTTTVLVTSLDTLHTSWTITTTTDGPYTTTETPALRCQHSERYQLVLTDVTATDSGSLGPRVAGLVNLLPRKPGVEMTADDVIPVLRDPPPIASIYRVRTDHWVYALRASVVKLCEDTFADDWDWSAIDAVAEASAGLRVARDWLFDGKRTLGDVVTECSLLHGCSPVLRSGRLALHAWGWPDAQASTALTITRADIIGAPTWSRWQEGLANRVSFKSPDLQINGTQAQSRARYGPGREVRVELAGLDDQASPIGDPQDFARGVMGRLELWGEPLAVVRVKLSGEHTATLELGRELTASEWMLPDGAGGRGLSSTRAVVVARDVDLGAAVLTVDAIVFGHTSHPYAPCARVNAQLTTSKVSVRAPGYVNGSSSYSGGEDVEDFVAGMKCDLISREAVPVIDAGVTITVVSNGARSVEFASPMSAGIQARIAAGAIVDLRFATYSVVIAAQEDWMYVGDDTTRVIDSTAEAAREVAP
jgi:hypothetical protein